MSMKVSGTDGAINNVSREWRQFTPVRVRLGRYFNEENESAAAASFEGAAANAAKTTFLFELTNTHSIIMAGSERVMG